MENLISVRIWASEALIWEFQVFQMLDIIPTWENDKKN